MLIGQVILYITTALPFVSNMVYNTVTQYIPSSSKSAYRIAAENLSLTATGSFGTFLFNGVSVQSHYKLSYSVLVIVLYLYIDCTSVSS